MTAPPPTIEVGPHRYRVQMVPGGALGDAGQAGHCASHRLTIAICDDQADSQVADTLCHELVHALLACTDLEDDVEERVALVLGPGLLLLLRRNPDLVSFLTACHTLGVGSET